ncbi:MAG: FkbM family methyltransferase [Patescibacteria group bacterium]
MIQLNYKEGFNYKSLDGNGLSNGNMPEIQDRLKKLITHDMVYVDCGAHIGTMSIPVIAATRPQRSILVEANPEVIGLLKENCELNLLEQDVLIVNKAVCDRDEEIDFYVLHEKSDSSSMVRENIMKVPSIRVPGVTLDTLLKDVEGEIVMKVDIEAAELLMWKGMSKVRPKIRHIVMEWFPNGTPAGWCEELLKLIHQSNYEILLHSGEALKDSEIMAFGKEDLWLRSL